MKQPVKKCPKLCPIGEAQCGHLMFECKQLMAAKNWVVGLFSFKKWVRKGGKRERREREGASAKIIFWAR